MITMMVGNIILSAGFLSIRKLIYHRPCDPVFKCPTIMFCSQITKDQHNPMSIYKNLSRFVECDKYDTYSIKTLDHLLRCNQVCEAQPPAKFQWFRPNGEPVLHDNEKILIDNEKNK